MEGRLYAELRKSILKLNVLIWSIEKRGGSFK
jgi:hypothetical protein